MNSQANWTIFRSQGWLKKCLKVYYLQKFPFWYKNALSLPKKGIVLTSCFQVNYILHWSYFYKRAKVQWQRTFILNFFSYKSDLLLRALLSWNLKMFIVLKWMTWYDIAPEWIVPFCTVGIQVATAIANRWKNTFIDLANRQNWF